MFNEWLIVCKNKIHARNLQNEANHFPAFSFLAEFLKIYAKQIFGKLFKM